MFDDIEQNKYFSCECHSPEHTLVFNYISGRGCHEVYTTTFLDNGSIFNRIKVAIKHILGYKCKYGHFDCFILRESELDKLIALLQEYKSDIKTMKEKK